MRLIFSRNRPAQLDLLIRSIEAHLHPLPALVMAHASDADFLRGYESIGVEAETDEMFDPKLRQALDQIEDKGHSTVTFFCDDDVCIRDHKDFPEGHFLGLFPTALTYSLRLGIGNKQQRTPSTFPVWAWRHLDRHDFGFPGSVDGHVFRIAHVRRAIEFEWIASPTILETALAAACEHMFDDKPLMGCPYEQVVVGVPVNRVSPHSGVEFGKRFPLQVKDANDRFLAGERIALSSVDASVVDACHREFEFVWEPRP